MTLSQDQFSSLIPGNDGTVLYSALHNQAQKALEQKSHSSSTSGSGISIGIIVGVVIGGIGVVGIAIAIVYKVHVTRARR